MPDIATWLAKLPQLVANPGDIMSLSFAQLEETLAGTVDVTDPTNPVILVLENSAVNSAAAINSYETYTRRQYGQLAQSRDDLYVHMSDVDYIDRFASPASANFYLLLEIEELAAALVPTGVNGIKKVTIPRFTQVTVAGVTFTMQYPIDIRQAASGGFQIVYNQDVLSPIQTLETNIVPWTVVTLKDTVAAGVVRQFISLQIPMRQFKISQNRVDFTRAGGVYQTFPYTDQFYYARAYSIAANGVATEIKTTHTDQVFDPTTPTLLLKDLGGSLNVELPQIYLTNRLVGSEIRVDIYTSQGAISMALDAYVPDDFNIILNGASPADTPYVAPLTTFKTMSLYSNAATTGGANAMSFTDLRNQVLLNNFGPVNLPITPTQLDQSLTNLGYQPVIQVDDVTDRVILATRELPVPSNNTTVAGASMGVETLVASYSDLVGRRSVMDNGERITILPSMLYQLVNGVLTVVSDATLDAMNAMAKDALVRTINNGTYLYAPFHYVLDANNDTFALRAYYLDSPQVNTIQFVDENETAGYEIGTQDKTLVRTATGYQLRVMAKSSQNWKDLPDDAVYCQLAFIPEGEKTYAYMNGTLETALVSGERVFTFNLGTNYDIDVADDLVLTSFQMFDDAERKHGVSLTADFDLFWAADGVIVPGVTTTQIDEDMGKQLMTDTTLGLVRERLNISLGSSLTNMWRRSRTVAGSGVYKTYLTDVPATYAKDVYLRDPVTGNVEFTVVDGKVVMTKLHSAGDVVMVDGQPTYLHKAGDAMLDAQGNPILVSDGTLKRQIDLVLVEGVYYFATQDKAAAYKATIPQVITNWVNGDLATLSQRLLEKTSLYFYPKSTVGDMQVKTQNGQTVTISAGQTFSLNYQLDDAAWRNTDLRQPLFNTAVNVIATALAQKTVAMTTLTATLQASVGSDVVGFDLTGFGDDGLITVVTVLDDSMRLTIRKQAVLEADGTLGVGEGVNVGYVKHDTSTSLTGL